MLLLVLLCFYILCLPSIFASRRAYADVRAAAPAMGIAVAQDVASNMTTPTLYDQYGSLALDNFQPIASQHATTIILAPCVAGWLSSIFLSGYALSYSIAYLTSPLRSEPKRIQALLVTVVLLVIANAAVHGVEIAHYLISQRRSFEDFQIFHWSDAIAPLPQALCQGLVQFLLAVRALSVRFLDHGALEARY